VDGVDVAPTAPLSLSLSLSLFFSTFYWEKVGRNNIVRNENNPTVDGVDVAPTAPLSLSLSLSLSFSLFLSTFLSDSTTVDGLVVFNDKLVIFIIFFHVWA